MIYTKHERPAGWLKLSDGSEWSIGVAVTRGIVIKCGETEGNIYVENRSLPAKAWIEAGVLDEEGANHVLALPQAKNPQAAAILTQRTAAPRVRFDPFSPEGEAVEALLTFLESSMQDSDKVKLASTLRSFARRACGISR